MHAFFLRYSDETDEVDRQHGRSGQGVARLPRRRFLQAVATGTVGAVAARAAARATPPASLRSLAGGRPLIGAAVPTNFSKQLSHEAVQILAEQFDTVTPANAMKWQSLCPEEGVYRFQPVDNLVTLARDNGQRVIGHTLLFNRDGNYPDWIFRDRETEADARVVWRRVESHVETLMGRYEGRIDSWDVLNEFVEPHEPGYRVTALTRVLGQTFPERLFKLAASIDPRAKLIYNDFAVEQPNRRKAVQEFVRSLLDRGCRIDVVGSQSHLESDDDVGEQIDAMIKDFAGLGVRVALTELDVDVISRKLYWNPETRPQAVAQNPYVNGAPDDVLELQADVYRQVFDAVLTNRKHVDRVTFWGVTDADSWLNHWPWERVNHGLLFDRDGKPKPAYHALAEALAAAE